MPYAEIRKWTLTFSHVEALSRTWTSWSCRKKTSFGYKFTLGGAVTAAQADSVHVCLTLLAVLFYRLSCGTWRGLLKQTRLRLHLVTWNWYNLPRSYSDETASLSFERECAWTHTSESKIDSCECGCATPRNADSHSGKNVWNPSSTFTVIHWRSQQR